MERLWWTVETVSERVDQRQKGPCALQEFGRNTRVSSVWVWCNGAICPIHVSIVYVDRKCKKKSINAMEKWRQWMLRSSEVRPKWESCEGFSMNAIINWPTPTPKRCGKRVAQCVICKQETHVNERTAQLSSQLEDWRERAEQFEARLEEERTQVSIVLSMSPMYCTSGW